MLTQGRKILCRTGLRVKRSINSETEKKTARWRSGWVGGAVVLRKRFLRHTIEGEHGNGSVTTWSGDTPRAMGAGPTGEVVLFDPDQAFTHTSPAFCVWDWSSAATDGAHRENERGG